MCPARTLHSPTAPNQRCDASGANSPHVHPQPHAEGSAHLGQSCAEPSVMHWCLQKSDRATQLRARPSHAAILTAPTCRSQPKAHPLPHPGVAAPSLGPTEPTDKPGQQRAEARSRQKEGGSRQTRQSGNTPIHRPAKVQHPPRVGALAQRGPPEPPAPGGAFPHHSPPQGGISHGGFGTARLPAPPHRRAGQKEQGGHKGWQQRWGKQRVGSRPGPLGRALGRGLRASGRLRAGMWQAGSCTQLRCHCPHPCDAPQSTARSILLCPTAAWPYTLTAIGDLISWGAARRVVGSPSPHRGRQEDPKALLTVSIAVVRPLLTLRLPLGWSKEFTRGPAMQREGESRGKAATPKANPHP